MTDDEHKPGSPPGSDRGVYGISVAAELSGINEQSLRLYERQGLLTPARSEGGTRRYSADDLARLQRISELVAAGVNLAGVARILDLEDRNELLNERNAAREDDNAAQNPPKPAANQPSDDHAPDTGPGLPRPARECRALIWIPCGR